MKLLNDLLAPWQTDLPAIAIKGISDDSRTLEPHELFFALTPDYIAPAIQRGAAAIVSAHPLNSAYAVPIYYLPNLADKLGEIAARYYDYPSQKLTVIGITGTSGKTSCTHLIAQALTHAGIKAAVIGTLGNGLLNHLQTTHHTTPNALVLQKLLAEFHAQGIKIVAMEVSSHGLAQGRVNGTQFAIAAFTNLTHEHLDYHGTLHDYAAVKKRLFTWPHLKHAIINADDAYGQQWLAQLPATLAITLAPNLLLEQPVVQALAIQQTANMTTAEICTPWGKGQIQTSLQGHFNLQNLLITLAVLNLCDIPFRHSLALLKNLQAPPGRMQKLGGENGQPLVVIDYAHKPDALAKVLQTLRQTCVGQLWCIFGCGGNRDRAKRPVMGRIAEQGADHLILTDDNPRHEDPAIIIAEILKGLHHPQRVVIEHDRGAAIALAIQQARAIDTILIAGKGHEAEQVLGDVRRPFQDADVAAQHLLTY